MFCRKKQYINIIIVKKTAAKWNVKSSTCLFYLFLLDQVAYAKKNPINEAYIPLFLS